MKKLKLFAVLYCVILMLTGCSQASQVEDQAYVLVMGLDYRQDGKLEMTVQIPKISGGSGDSGSGGGGKSENYMQLSVCGDDFEEALEMLDWASPRDTNLSQMKLIVLSSDLAGMNICKKLIANIAQTERLFTATKIAVCEGSAKDFVKAIQPNIGTRLSTDIEAMFDHYNDRGYLPESSLADLYYQTESVYSDPMVGYALKEKTAPGNQETSPSKPTSALAEPVRKVSEAYQSSIETRYLGAALFSQGKMCGVLSGEQTILANLIRNELDSFRYRCDGQSLEFVPTRPVYLGVDTNSVPVKISVNAALSFAAQEKVPNKKSLETKLTNEISNLIKYTQSLGAEPFGFAERAARSFITIDDWYQFNWKNAYQNAEIDVNIRLAQSDA